MQLFYTREIEGNRAHFNNEESGHCIRVLRMRKGDHIIFTDGRGFMYKGVIRTDDNKEMEAEITERLPQPGHSYHLHIAISPLKNNDRLEWFIEKAVELGIDEITPIICSHTEKNRVRRERLEGIILSAMKQSLKAFLPVLNQPAGFSEFVNEQHNGKKLIAHCNHDSERKAISDVIIKGEEVLIMIGPEGDFTREEIDLAISKNFVPVHLGESRLRTETAGLAACCSVYFTNL